MAATARLIWLCARVRYVLARPRVGVFVPLALKLRYYYYYYYYYY